ncbi:MAG TPA: SoxXA-binding protein [Gammaproteobacteria bacterium]|nr:SoxXA-binding protein [Gammaproteobacteria bacterium]
MKKLLLAATAALFLNACTNTPPGASADDAKTAISKAVQKTQQAAKVDYEWRDTGKIIKKAKAALKKGDIDTAIKLANKARRQSDNALKQYAEQRNAGPRFN